MKKLVRCGIDCDDVLYQCNAYAIKLMNKKYGFDPQLTIEELHTWEPRGDRSDCVFECFSDEEFYRTQPLVEGAREFICKLSEIAEVFITTAVPGNYMSIRAKRLMEDFGDLIDEQHLIMGSRKDVYNLDIMLDDNSRNILKSNAKFPVLMRQPWNSHLTGRLAVNNLTEAYAVIKEIIADGTILQEAPKEKLACLIGPSGSGKTELIYALLEDEHFGSRFEKPSTSTTREKRDDDREGVYHYMSREEFLEKKKQGLFFESTVYANEFYGIMKSDIEAILERGHIPVMTLDISGAMAIRMHYRGTKLIFVDRNREEVIASILKRNVPDEDKIKRIISLNDEYKNVNLCDVVIKYRNTGEEALRKLIEILQVHLDFV